MNRPLVWVALAFIAGLFVASTGFVSGLWWPLALCLAAAILPFWAHDEPRLRAFSVALMFLAVGMLVWNLRHAGPPGDSLSRTLAQDTPDSVLIAGYVRSVQPRHPETDFQRLIVDVDTAEWNGARHSVRGRLSIAWNRPGAAVWPGERIRARGEPRLGIAPVNFGVNGLEDTLRRRGVHSTLRANGPDAIEHIGDAPWWSVAYWAARLRQVQAEQLRAAMSPEALNFALAVWLGDGSVVTDDEYEAYLRSGTAHILAISGLNIALIYATLRLFLRIFLRSRRAVAAITVGAVFVFALTAGAQVSCLRAAVMVAIYLCAEFFDREPDSPTALSLSALLFLLVSPDLLFDGGFQLSFLCVASMLVFGDPITERLSVLPRPFGEGLAATLSPQILSLPVATHLFHILPLLSPLANLVVVPLLGVVLWLLLVTLLLAPLLPAWALVFGHAAAPVIWAIRAVSSLAAGPSVTALYLTSPSVWAVAAYAIAVAGGIWAFLYSRQRRRALAVMLVALLLAVPLWGARTQQAGVDFLDVGHGDAAFIRTPGGSTVLVDGGDQSQYVRAGSRVVAPFLWAHGVSRIDHVVVSHPDRDHLAGLLRAVRDFRVGEVVLSRIASQNALETELLTLCASRGIPVRRVARGDRIVVRGAELDVLNPPREGAALDGTNNNSVVLRLRWPGLSVLLSGDIEAEAEAGLAGLDLAADVLKAPHHASRTSSTPGLLAGVRPRHVIVSTGGKSGREPADSGVLARYHAAGAHVWRTDQMGGIRVTAGADGLSIETARGVRGSPIPATPMR